MAIEKGETWGENDKINEESQVRGSDYIFLPQPGGKDATPVWKE
jgi:hypothetical protein